MKDGNTWSRRQFSKAVISAQLLLASGVLSLACADDKKLKSNTLLTDAENDALKFAMDEIIPANNTMPSASEVGGVLYVLTILEELPELIPLFQGALAKLESSSLITFNSGFSELSSDNRITILQAIEISDPELFGVLKNFTYESYYTNEKVFPLIGYEPHPTGTSGPDMEPFDEKLLDRVKNVPPMYTKI
jgi:hypothetical protein